MVTPELAFAMLAAFAVLKEDLKPGELENLIAMGYAERIFDRILTQAVFDVAFQPVRDKLRWSLSRAVEYVAREVPPPPAATGRTLAISFDVLNPRVVDAIKSLETRVITTLEDSIRETVRQAIQAGIEAGQNPRTMARGLRDVIGLAPNQEQEVRNFRAALEGLDGRNPLTYTLRDKRFDAAIKRGDLTPVRIDQMVTRYRERRVAQNAETNARTASLDAYKMGQRLSWQDAIDKGIVDSDRLRHQWIGVGDARERPEHKLMNDEVARWDKTYSNGQLIPGETDFNCRCIDRFFLAPAVPPNEAGTDTSKA